MKITPKLKFIPVSFEDKYRWIDLFKCFILNKHEWEEVVAPRFYEYRCVHCGRKRI